MEPESQEYYEPCIRGYNAMQAPNAIMEYLEATEPDGEKPTHQRVLSLNRAEAIAGVFLADLAFDIARNTKFAWKRMTPIAAKNNYRQPIAEEPSGESY